MNFTRRMIAYWNDKNYKAVSYANLACNDEAAIIKWLYQQGFRYKKIYGTECHDIGDTDFYQGGVTTDDVDAIIAFCTKLYGDWHIDAIYKGTEIGINKSYPNIMHCLTFRFSTELEEIIADIWGEFEKAFCFAEIKETEQWGYSSSNAKSALPMERCDVLPKRVDMSQRQTVIPPEQIEQLAYRDLININWESCNMVNSATTYAQFLFECYYYFFYIPETGTFFAVEKDGNYYQGYETIVKKCSKEEVLAAASRSLAYARRQCLGENIITNWENICSMISEL